MLRLYLPGVRWRVQGTHRRRGVPSPPHPLRLQAGARLRVLDDAGGEHDVVLDRVGARGRSDIVASARPERESPPSTWSWRLHR
jgi:hypothetical protein